MRLKNLLTNTSKFLKKAINDRSIYIVEEPIAAEKLDQAIILIEHFFNEIDAAKKTYITFEYMNEHFKKYQVLFDFTIKHPKQLSSLIGFNDFKNEWNHLSTNIQNWNNEYIEYESNKHKDFFSNINGISLDKQQIKAVIANDKYNLVIAGAGSGKTLTIIAKVKYLVEIKHIKPEEILVMSFNNKVSKEITNKINKQLGLNVKINTFHKFGMDVMKYSENTLPEISERMEKYLDLFLHDYIMKDISLVKKLIKYFVYYINVPYDFYECDDFGEYIEQQKNSDYETLKSKNMKYSAKHQIEDRKNNLHTINNEVVKSAEEVIIANFLYMNGINYEYECIYPFDNSDGFHKRYRPDFYLIDYDIYLEHFGTSKDMKVPWLSTIEEKKYLEGIEWKRKLHKINKTTLLETYSYYNSEGTLLLKLEEMLKDKKVIFSELNYEEIYKKLYNDKENKYVIEFKKLIKSFISLYKTKYYDNSKFQQFSLEASHIPSNFNRERIQVLLETSLKFYNYYQESLLKENTIDFNDMLNKAEDSLEERYFKIKLKYVIIDEFQDISFNRYNLLNKICYLNNSNLMCVGDDWQSIYQFAGSDIQLFTNFKKYFKNGKILYIENTYRNSQELIDIAGNFILKNKFQIPKSLKSKKNLKNPIRIISYNQKIYGTFKLIIEEIVSMFGSNTDILLLGRNNYDINSVIENDELTLKSNRFGSIIYYTKYPNLKISYLTAHKAKGVEATNVIVINNINHILGFPNKISDDTLLSYVTSYDENIKFSEERRLFYVAITRTKNYTYLLTPSNNPSIFITELIKNGIKAEIFENGVIEFENPLCPRCKSGHLVLRKNKNNGKRFLACSNYPQCDYMTKNVRILEEQILCPECGGYMVTRNGKYGPFYGCTNYPYCKNIIKIDKHTY